MKRIHVRFRLEAGRSYETLKKLVQQREKPGSKPSYGQLLKSIDQAIVKIGIDYRCGDLIPRKYLTKQAIERYGTDRIFRLELVGYWRLLYTVVGTEAEIIAFILEYMDHKTYNKLFGYRKR